MAMTEAQKKAQIEHQRRTYDMLSVKIRKEEAAAFRKYAEDHNTTMNAVLKAHISALLGTVDGGEPGLVPVVYTIQAAVAQGLREEAARRGVHVDTLVGALLAEHWAADARRQRETGE